MKYSVPVVASLTIGCFSGYLSNRKLRENLEKKNLEGITDKIRRREAKLQYHEKTAKILKGT